MGTNYYLIRDVCECCGRGGEPLHIGKSSGGWCFGLCTHDDPHVLSLNDWEKLWAEPKSIIRDEYGETITTEEMRNTIVKRKWRDVAPHDPEFLRRNSAQNGPNGLLRHRVDGRHCIAHGDGTYDLLQGEFS